LFKSTFQEKEVMVAIKRGTLEAIVLAARNTYPNEFIALLSSKGKKKIIDEFVLLPSIHGKTYSSIRLDLLPYNAGTKGSAHSHPSPNAFPSRGDLRAFKHMGKIHLIIAFPFSIESTRVFDAKGKELEIEVVE